MTDVATVDKTQNSTMKESFHVHVPASGGNEKQVLKVQIQKQKC
jgi:hypothetical protein